MLGTMITLLILNPQANARYYDYSTHFNPQATARYYDYSTHFKSISQCSVLWLLYSF